MNFHEDDRAQRLFDIFPKVNGQINVSYVNSTEHIVAWHKHNIQYDYWCCVKGYKALEPNSILLYYLTEKWTPDDEEKVKPGYFGENWKTEDK